MENEIDYDKFAELMNKKKSDFKNDVFKTVNILNVSGSLLFRFKFSVNGNTIAAGWFQSGCTS